MLKEVAPAQSDGDKLESARRQHVLSMMVVFKGPVHRTEKKTEIGLNRTDWDRTSGLFLDRSFAAWLLVFHFKKYCGTTKRPVQIGCNRLNVTCIKDLCNHDFYLQFDPCFMKNG